MPPFLTRYSKYIKYLVLAVILYLPIFGYLNKFPIRIWDEARVAINAFEMYKNGNFIVTHFEGNPDLWNTKPPFLIWLQVLFMHILGVNEWAIRLPSALATLFTCIALLVFSIKYKKDFWFGFIAVVVLITSTGYISLHGTRTGDYDALLTFFTTISGLSFFMFCETKRTRYLYTFFAATALAVLTKSVTGLLFLPAIVLYSLLQKQVLPLLKNKHFYIGLVSCIGAVLGYFFLREAVSPGYLKAVYANDLGGRFGEALDEHKEYFWFYYNNFIHHRLPDYYLLVPAGFIVGLFVKDEKINKITLFSSLMVFCFFMTISAAETKLEWYDLPMYPYLALLITAILYFIFVSLQNLDLLNQNLRYNIAPFVFLFIVTTLPYQKILNKSYKPEESSSDQEFYAIGYYLRDALNGKQTLDGNSLLYGGYNAHNQFYTNALREKGIDLPFRDWTTLSPGDSVITTQGDVKQYIIDNYHHQVIKEVGTVVCYKIDGRK